MRWFGLFVVVSGDVNGSGVVVVYDGVRCVSVGLSEECGIVAVTAVVG